MKSCVVKLSILKFSKTCYLDSKCLIRLIWPLIAKTQIFVMFLQSCEKLCLETFHTKVLRKRVILTPNGVNRLLWPFISKKHTFIMFVQSCEKLCRESFHTKVPRKRVILTPNGVNRLLWSFVSYIHTFIMFVKSCESWVVELSRRKFWKPCYFDSPSPK